MIEERAQVIAIDGDKVTVEVQVKSTCNACQAQKDCGTGAIASAFSHRAQTLSINTPMQFNIGDTVVIGVAEKSVLVASWWLYLMPLMVFICAIWLATSQLPATTHELLLFFIALMLAFLAFLWVSGYLKRLDRGRFQPVILRKQ